jgi:competence protein ComFB
MAYLDMYDFDGINNEGREFVLEELGKQLEAYKKPLCRCNECVCDMATLALNHVRPLYRRTLTGKMYTDEAMEQDQHYASEIKRAVSEAIEKIRANPGHEDGFRPAPGEEAAEEKA